MFGLCHKVEVAWKSINDLEIKSPPSKKSKVSESNSTKQGINSTLYVADAHSRPDNQNSNISKLLDSLKGSNPSLHFLEIVNTSCQKKCQTKFGFKPEGSVLGVKCHYHLLALKHILQISPQMISVM